MDTRPVLFKKKVLFILVLTPLIALLAIGFALAQPSTKNTLDHEKIRPGDYRGNYETKDYVTRSRSLQDRKGKEADLYYILKNPGVGLPPVSIPSDNPVNAKKIKLGRLLFYDRRLSFNDTMSCATCHVPEMGFTNNELKTPIGFEGRSVRRNAPTLLNVAYKKRLFFDARESTLETQAWGRLLSSNEMANPSIGYVLKKIKSIPDYKNKFENVFGESVNIKNLGQALAQYQRALVSGGSRFDLWYYAKQKDSLNEQEIAGFELFSGKAQCVTCHLVGKQYALFKDEKLHNTGLGYEKAMEDKKPVRVQIAPGVFTELEHEVIDNVSAQKRQNDLGLYEITQNPQDRWKYLTPSLRNIALTAPYMHNGELLTLEDVIEFYNQGGIANENLSPLIRPLGLSQNEKAALIAFLKSLTGGNIKTLVADAFAVPVGDLTQDDPFWSHKQ